MDQRLLRKVRELDTLYQISTRLQKLTSTENLEQEIIDVLASTMGYQFGAVLLIDEESGEMSPYAVIRGQMDEQAHAFDKDFVASQKLMVGRGITGWVAEKGQSACVGDVREDARYFGVRTSIRSELCVPLKVDDRVIGIINIENTSVDAYNLDDLMFMEAVANQVAIAIENTRLHQQLQQQANDLEKHVHERTAELSAANDRLTREIEDRTRTEEELERSVSLFQTTLESTADGILVLDNAGNNIVTFNQRFLAMWHIPSALAISGNDDDLLKFVLKQLKDPQGFLARVKALYRDPEAEDYDMLEFEDGRLFERYSYPQRLGDEIIGRVWSFRDISEREKLGRMKDEFISVVSHELRTPLTSIHGALKLLLGGVGGDLRKDVRDLLDLALNNSNRLALLVDDILDLEKIESGQMVFDNKAIELSGIIRQSIEANRPYGEKYHITYQVGALISDVEVMVDPDRLMQVMGNLLSNAAKFSPAGESVMVRMIRMDGDVRVQIEDRGPGIPEDEGSQVFQKFYQADASDAREKGGTGLGLSICQSIVERLNGRIGFLPNENQGTVFYFDLPIWKRSPDLAG